MTNFWDRARAERPSTRFELEVTLYSTLTQVLKDRSVGSDRAVTDNCDSTIGINNVTIDSVSSDEPEMALVMATRTTT